MLQIVASLTIVNDDTAKANYALGAFDYATSEHF